MGPQKPLIAVAFWILPLRILSYAFVSKPGPVVWLLRLDGVATGIYAIAVVAFSADLTRQGRIQHFDSLFATALAIGGVVGPVVSGILVERLGFHIAFDTSQRWQRLARWSLPGSCRKRLTRRAPRPFRK